MTEEHKIQNAIRNDLAGECLLFRANVGKAWVGSDKRLTDGTVLPAYQRLPNGDLLIRNPRPFDTGLPPGFSDLFGLVQITITPEMVGTTVGIFVAPEVKTAKGKPSDAQVRFLRAINDNGGRAGIVRSPADARKLVLGGGNE